MPVRYATSKETLRSAAAASEPGDCIQIECFSAVAEGSSELLPVLAELCARGVDFVSLREEIDTRRNAEVEFFSLCRSLHALDMGKNRARKRDGIEKAKQEKRYKGRKPITIDEELFASVISQWRSGEITAREAMTRLKLKPNTFYRRIKEQEERSMNDYKQAGKEIKSEIKEAAKQSRRELDALKKQVRAEAKEVKKTAEEQLELRDVEREIRHDRIRAEAEHKDSVRQLKKEVEAEVKQLKDLGKDC